MKNFLIFFLIFIFIIIGSSVAYAESSEIAVNVKQLSEIRDEIQDSNLINLSLLAISIIISSVAVFATILTAYYLKRQVKTMELEFESKSEPMLIVSTLEPSQVFLHNGDVRSYNSWLETAHNPSDLLKVSMRFVIKNVGHGVARDIFQSMHTDENKFSRIVFEDIKESNTNTILSPNQEFRRLFYIDGERWYDLQLKHLFVGISIAYMGLKNKKYTGTIYGIRHGGNYVLDSW